MPRFGLERDGQRRHPIDEMLTMTICDRDSQRGEQPVKRGAREAGVVEPADAPQTYCPVHDR